METNLGCLNYEDLEANGHLTVKKTMWGEKAQWISLRIPEVTNYYQTLDPEEIRSGQTGLYIQPNVIYYGTPLYLLWLDVEHPKEHHSSIPDNIRTAQALYYLLDQLELTEDLTIGLSGKAFRFVWPWVIPYLYTGAFLEMINDKKRFSGIDPSPQTGTNKFLRMLAFRGHNNQGTPAFTASIHYLDHAQEILSLDLVKYKNLTHRRPDVARYSEDLNRILPNKMAPAALIKVLEAYEFKRKIKSTIAIPGAPRVDRVKGTNWGHIHAFLEEEGITYTKHAFETTDIVKLDFCPVCKESEGNPYITPSGRLKCFRANKCPAGQTEKGLPPYEWVQGYTCQETVETEIETPRMGLQEARDLLPQAFQTDEDIVVNASPGVGKTYAAIEHFAPQAESKLVLYTGPTLSLCLEQYQKALDKHPQIDARFIEGRNETNCENIDDVAEAAAMGYLPARTVCLRCEHRKTCLYKKQFEDLPEAGLIFTSHKMARYLVNQISPEIWIIDENPLHDFFEVLKVSQDEMDTFMETEPGDVQPLFKEIKRISVTIGRRLKTHEQGRLYVSDVPPGNWENAVILEDIHQVITKYFELGLYPCNSSQIYSHIENPVVWENNNYKEKRNMKCIKWWDLVIKGDPKTSLFVEISKPKRKTEIHYKATQLDPPVFPDCQIVHLDGTVYRPELPELFQKDVEIIDAQAHLSTCRKTHIRISRGKYKVMRLQPQVVSNDLKMLIEHLRPQDQKVLVITFKTIEKFVAQAIRELYPDLDFSIIHFWGPRGINEYENYHACLVYGTPTVSPAGVEDLASAMFAEQEEMDKWKASLGRRDLTQAIHRIRPVNGDKNIVVMGSYWPTEYLGQPDEIIDLMRKGDNFQTAVQRLVKFATEYGFVDKPVANMLGIGTKTDKKAVEAWQTAISAAQGGHDDHLFTLIDILYYSGEVVEGTPPAAIYLGKNGGWGKLMDCVRDETGLPVMGTYRATGRGGLTRVLGTVEKMKQFYQLMSQYVVGG
jgi:hypothetical protein